MPAAQGEVAGREIVVTHQKRKYRFITDRPRGRPPKPIDLDKLRELCKYMLRDYEVAVALDVSLAHFVHCKAASAEMREAMREGYELGKGSLRAIQFRQAKNNVAMAIWLGKQYLDQRDRFEHSNDPDAPMPAKITMNFANAEEAAAAFEAALRKK